MIEIQNFNPDFKRISKKFLVEVAGYVLAKEKAGKKTDISVVITDSEEIRRLNLLYRKKDKPTDILSFGSIKDFSSIESFDLPEIIICPEEVRKNAEEYGVSFKNELVRVLIHGVLHLLGYDHEKNKEDAEKMFAKQEKYHLEFLKIKK